MYYPHDFHMVRGELKCEGVSVSRIAKAVDTPLYVYSSRTLLEHVRKLRWALRALRPLICFSVKANGNLAILRLLVRAGTGLDIVSGGELFRAQQAGCPASRIVFASVGKRLDEIRAALKYGIFCFNVESPQELECLDEAAAKMRRVARVALRINPEVDVKTHHHLRTAGAQSKFGIGRTTALSLLRRHHLFRRLRFIGIHLHIGSQITEVRPFVEAIRRVSEVVRSGRRTGLQLEYFNLGGGLGIIYKDERPQTPRAFARYIVPLLRSLKVRVILEPGRFIAGNAGILVTRVLYTKEMAAGGAAVGRGARRFAVVDAGMTDMLRPALYGAYHEVIPLRKQHSPVAARGAFYDIVGPVCESADVLARRRKMGPLAQGDLLAIFGAGAYGSAMASNYNGRLRPAEVLVRGSRWAVIRRRDSLKDLIRNDVVPRWLAE